MRITKLFAAAFAAAAILALPTVAGAEVFNVPAGDTAAITTAVDDAGANSESDVINLAAGTYNNVNSGTFFNIPSEDPNGHSITINGAGVGQTILNGESVDFPVVRLQLSTTTSTMSGFTLNAATGPFVTGFDLRRGNIEDFEINRTAGTGGTNTANNALELAGGTRATDGKINSNGQGNAVRSSGDNVTMRRLELVGDNDTSSWGLNFAGDSTDVFMSRVKVRGFQYGMSVQSGHIEIEDSLFEVGAGAQGLVFMDQSSGVPSSINVDAYRNTIVGGGAFMGTQEALDAVDVEFRDNLFHNPGGTAISCTGSAVSLSASGTAYFATSLTSNCTGFSDTVTLSGSPFVDLGAGDFRPAAGSAIVDAGIGTASATGGLDLAGAERVTDGNGDGSAIVDIGAFEYQPPFVPPVTPPTSGTTPPSPAVAIARVTAKAKKAFTRGSKGFAAPKKKQPFFTVSFTDTAKATFTLQSIGKKKKLKKLKGSASLAVKAGANKFAFNGKFGGKKLKAGSYRVTITPLAADGTAGKAVTVDIKLK